MSYTPTPSRKLMISTNNRSPWEPSHEQPRYVSPTFRSSVFNQTDDANLLRRCKTPSATSMRCTEESKTRGIRIVQGPAENRVLPTTLEWNPKRSDINDPKAFDNVHQKALEVIDRKAEEVRLRAQERKEKMNQEVREMQKALDEKHAVRLDHKKPKDTDLKCAKEENEDYGQQIKQKLQQIKEERMGYAADLERQKADRLKRKKEETDTYKYDNRIGFEINNKRAYDMDEHKKVLDKQLDEKRQRKEQTEKLRQEEKNERIREHHQQQEMMKVFQRGEHPIQRAKSISIVSFNQAEFDKSRDASPLRNVLGALASNNDEKGRSKSPLREGNPERVLFSAQIEQKIKEDKQPKSSVIGWKGSEKPRRQVSMDLSSGLKSPALIKEVLTETKTDFEVAAIKIIQKKNEQQEYLKNLKDQIVAKKANREAEVTKSKDLDKNTTGILNFRANRPKESIEQVTEIQRKQIVAKIENKASQAQLKKEENVKHKEAAKAEEAITWKAYQEYVKDKANMATQMKKDMVTAVSHKKHKGLRTVKI